MKRLFVLALLFCSSASWSQIITGPLGTVTSDSIAAAGGGISTNFFSGYFGTNHFWIDDGGNALTNGPGGSAVSIGGQYDWFPSGLYGAAYYQNSNSFWNGNMNYAAKQFNGIWVMTNSFDPNTGSPSTPYAWSNFPFTATNRDATYPSQAITGKVAIPLAETAFSSFQSLSMSANAQVSQVPYFGVDIQNGNNWTLPPTETTLTNIVSLFKANGISSLRPYLVLDTGWSTGNRDANGNIGQSAGSWPDGIAYAAGLVHSNNMYIGFHVCLAVNNNGEPGTAGSAGKYIQQDANYLVNSNKTDYLLVDTFDIGLGNGIGANTTNEQTLAESFLNYVRSAACSNGIPVHMMLAANTQYPYEFQPWMARDWNSYTVSGDGIGTLAQVLQVFRQSIVQIPYTSPGHIPEFGTIGTSNNAVEFTKMELGMTALLPANQWWGVTNFSAGIIVLLTNADYQSVWRDPLVKGGRLISTNGACQLWARDLDNGQKAVFFLNTNFAAGVTQSFNFDQIGIPTNIACNVKSVWYQTNQTVTGSFGETVGTLTSDIFIITPRYSPLGLLNVAAAGTFNGNGSGITNMVSTNIVGSSGADIPFAGYLGEYAYTNLLSANALALSTATAANITNITLTAGDWEVTGTIGFKANAATTITSEAATITTTSATLGALDDGSTIQLAESLTGGVDNVVSLSTVRINIASTTKVYLVAKASFAVNTLSGYGGLRARRIR